MSGTVRVTDEYSGLVHDIVWDAKSTNKEFIEEVVAKFGRPGTVQLPTIPMTIIEPTDTLFATNNPERFDMLYFFPSQKFSMDLLKDFSSHEDTFASDSTPPRKQQKLMPAGPKPAAVKYAPAKSYPPGKYPPAGPKPAAVKYAPGPSSAADSTGPSWAAAYPPPPGPSSAAAAHESAGPSWAAAYPAPGPSSAAAYPPPGPSSPAVHTLKNKVQEKPPSRRYYFGDITYGDRPDFEKWEAEEARKAAEEAAAALEASKKPKPFVTQYGTRWVEPVNPSILDFYPIPKPPPIDWAAHRQKYLAEIEATKASYPSELLVTDMLGESTTIKIDKETTTNKDILNKAREFFKNRGRITFPGGLLEYNDKLFSNHLLYPDNLQGFTFHYLNMAAGGARKQKSKREKSAKSHRSRKSRNGRRSSVSKSPLRRRRSRSAQKRKVR